MPIFLETRRLILRDHTPEDLASHFALLGDETAMYYLPEVQADTLAQARENLLFSMAEIDRPDRAHVFLRVETKDGRHVGEVGYTLDSAYPMGKKVDLGYFSRSEMWGNGYVPEAARALLSYAFMRDNVYRVSCGCCADNARSERVMQKLGMTREAYFKQYVYLRGQLRDRAVYRLLKSEWTP